MRRRLIALCCLAGYGASLAGAAEQRRQVQVGIYQNEPKVFLDSNGLPAGFHVTILEEIAAREGWKLDYVPGSWAEGLERLEAGQIDLMTDVAYSEEREKRFDFNREAVLYNWARLYAREGTDINDLFDLEGRTVAVVKEDISYGELRTVVKSFGVSCTFIEVEGFKEVFEHMKQGKAEAGLMSRLFGQQHEHEYGVKKTFLVIRAVPLHFAAPKGRNADILAAIDRNLAQLKGDKQSVYYQAVDKWISSAERRGLPVWIRYATAGLLAVALLLGTFSVTLRRQVRVRTAALAQVNRELEQHRGHLESLVAGRTAELAAVNQELEAFSYSVSHDLRAPLRAMDGFSQALVEDYGGKLDGQGKDYLQRVRAASQKMAQLIDDLLNLSRVGRTEMHRGEVDLSALAREIAEDLRRAEPSRQVEMVIAKDLKASGDARLLRVVLVNLLGNAWKFTRKKPRARIEFGIADCGTGIVEPAAGQSAIRNPQSEIVFMVRDDGAGFDMSYANKLFGAFQRLHSAGEFEGTGIGLATVGRIIRRHGGRAWAEGAVGQGATFYFTLPIAEGGMRSAE